MFALTIFGLILFVTAAVVIAVITIYLGIYRRNINKAVDQSGKVHRKMPAPYKVALGVIAVVLVTYIVILAVLRAGGAGNDIPESYYDGKYTFKEYSSEGMTGGLSVYSIKENPGYEKFVEEKNNLRITYFLSETPYDTLHPTFLVYVEYTGEEEAEYYGYYGEFQTDSGAGLMGAGGAGAEYNDYVVFVGNHNMPCQFALNMYYYGSDYYEQADTTDIKEHAIAGDEIVISLD